MKRNEGRHGKGSRLVVSQVYADWPTHRVLHCIHFCRFSTNDLIWLLITLPLVG